MIPVVKIRHSSMKQRYLRMVHLGALLLFVCTLCCGIAYGKAVRDTRRTLLLFAAASLTDVITDLTDSYTSSHQCDVSINLVSSGTLARQMAQGAEPDVFISANRRWMTYVDSLGLIQRGMIATAAGNSLVLVAPSDSKTGTLTIDSTLALPSLITSGRLSLGDPRHVPAGKYAKEALTFFGWYATLTPHLLPAKDVRSALMMVEMSEAPLGIVYMTDANKSDKIKIIGTFPEESHSPIVYVIGVCRKSREGNLFSDFITSESAEPIWTKYGFKK